MLFNYLNKLKLLCVTVIMMIHNIAFAIDLQPGEIKAPLGTFYAAQMSYVYVEKGDKYSHGSKQLSTSNINQNAYLLRLSHAFEFNQMPAVVYAQSSINHLEHTNIPVGVANANSNGIGDTTLVFALWPYVDRAKEEYFGMAAYLTLPTGDYVENFDDGIKLVKLLNVKDKTMSNPDQKSINKLFANYGENAEQKIIEKVNQFIENIKWQ